MKCEDTAADAVAGFEQGDMFAGEREVPAAARPATPAPMMSTSVGASNPESF